MIDLKEVTVCTPDEALDQIQDFGLQVQSLDIDSSSIRRCRVDQKKTQDGFYRVFSIVGSNLVSGFYGSFYPVYSCHTLKSTREAPAFSDAQRHQMKFKQEESKRLIESAPEPDLGLWSVARECHKHPYLTKKKVKSYGLRDVKGREGLELILPMRNHEGKLTGLQRIFEDGSKKMAKGSNKKGSYHRIEGSDVVAICEGYATGATVHEATGWTVIVAYDCENMVKVAKYFKMERLVVMADDDWKTEGNPGQTKAKYIGERYSCPVLTPSFPTAMDKGSDWNDLGLDIAKGQLEGKEPLCFLDQCKEQYENGDLGEFLLSRKEYLAEYPKAEYGLLKNKMKGLFDITKGFMDDLVHGIKSEEELEMMEAAKDELKMVRYDGNSYFKLELSTDGDRYYKTTQQEVTLLLGIACGDDNNAKQDELNKIHRDRVVSEVSADPTIVGRSHIKEFLCADGTLVIKKMVSAEKIIESRLAELDDVAVDEGFISYIKENYAEVIDIMEAALARKFCESKKAFVYFRCPTSYGKTFFFGLESLSRSFTKKYDVAEFRGNSPDDFIKPLMLFIDEANCFPSDYKVNEPEYKRLYGGFAKVKLGLRVLACANPMEDLEAGVDPQLQERVVCIHPKEVRLDHHGIEKNLSRRMWEKWILNRLGNLILKWSQSEDVNKACESHFDAFLKKYDNQRKFISLDDVMKEHLEEMINTPEANFKGGKTFPFMDYMIEYEEGEYIIKSTKRFMKELFGLYDESRFKAYKSEFGNSESYGKSRYLSEWKNWKINGLSTKGVTFSAKMEGGRKVVRPKK